MFEYANHKFGTGDALSGLLVHIPLVGFLVNLTAKRNAVLDGIGPTKGARLDMSRIKPTPRRPPVARTIRSHATVKVGRKDGLGKRFEVALLHRSDPCLVGKKQS